MNNVEAFLHVIREGETNQTDDAYRMLVGGGYFDSFDDHPRKSIYIPSLGVNSTAAGAYQFLARTWDGLVKQYGFKDFSPANQDAAAVKLIEGRGALDDVKAGRFDDAIRKCNKEWASLPGSPYGQPVRDLSALREVYIRYGGTLAGSTVQPKVLTDTSDKPAPIVESIGHTVRKNTMAPFVMLAFEALSAFIPQLAKQFGGTEVSDRNIQGITTAVEVAKKAIGAKNEQELIDSIKADPTVKATIQSSIADNWFSIVEVGGGIPAAAQRSIEIQKAGPIWNNPAFVITLLLFVPVYAFFASVLGMLPGTVTWDDNVRMLVAGVVSNILSGAMGFWLGSSFGSQKKNDLLNSK